MFFLFNCYQALLWTGPNFFSSAVRVVLFSVSFIWSNFDFVIKVCFFLNGHAGLDVNKIVFVVVWFCCSSWLASLMLAGLTNLMRHFLLQRVMLFVGYLLFRQHFGKKTLEILEFSISSSFGRQLCQKCGWAGLESYEQSHVTKPLFCYEMQTLLQKSKKNVKKLINSNLSDTHLFFDIISVPTSTN